MIHLIYPLSSDVGEHSMVHSRNCGTMKLLLTDWQYAGLPDLEACYTYLKEKKNN